MRLSCLDPAVHDCCWASSSQVISAAVSGSARQKTIGRCEFWMSAARRPLARQKRKPAAVTRPIKSDQTLPKYGAPAKGRPIVLKGPTSDLTGAGFAHFTRVPRRRTTGPGGGSFPSLPAIHGSTTGSPFEQPSAHVPAPTRTSPPNCVDPDHPLRFQRRPRSMLLGPPWHRSLNG